MVVVKDLMVKKRKEEKKPGDCEICAEFCESADVDESVNDT